MSLNFNQSILGGRISTDVELKQTPSGISVTSFNVAVDRVPGKDGKKITDFITIIAWRKTAEFVTRHFQKGDPILVIGSIQVRSWDAPNNGGKRYATEVVADEVKFVESKSNSSSQASQPNAPYAAPLGQANFEEVSADEDLPF